MPQTWPIIAVAILIFLGLIIFLARRKEEELNFDGDNHESNLENIGKVDQHKNATIFGSQLPIVSMSRNVPIYATESQSHREFQKISLSVALWLCGYYTTLRIFRICSSSTAIYLPSVWVAARKALNPSLGRLTEILSAKVDAATGRISSFPEVYAL